MWGLTDNPSQSEHHSVLKDDPDVLKTDSALLHHAF